MALIFGALGLITTLADTVRLFVRADDHSWLALFQWGLWVVWLFVPIAWAMRAARSSRPFDPLGYLILGYATAGFALRVAELCLPH